MNIQPQFQTCLQQKMSTEQLMHVERVASNWVYMAWLLEAMSIV